MSGFDNEWIEWVGGELPTCERIDARMRNGEEWQDYTPALLATFFNWSRLEGRPENDIVAFRPLAASTPNTPASNDFVLVPREPTPKMVAATWDHEIDREGGLESQNTRNKRIYAAMLAAAPASPGPASNEAPSDMVRAIACVFTSMPERMANTHVSLDGQNLGTLWQLATDIASAVASASNEAPGRGGVEVYATAPTELRGEVIDITAGKAYRVLREDRALFEIHDDVGFRLTCAWEDCAHLYGDGWTRSERRA